MIRTWHSAQQSLPLRGAHRAQGLLADKLAKRNREMRRFCKDFASGAMYGMSPGRLTRLTRQAIRNGIVHSRSIPASMFGCHRVHDGSLITEDEYGAPRVACETDTPIGFVVGYNERTMSYEVMLTGGTR